MYSPWFFYKEKFHSRPNVKIGKEGNQPGTIQTGFHSRGEDISRKMYKKSDLQDFTSTLREGGGFPVNRYKPLEKQRSAPPLWQYDSRLHISCLYDDNL